MSPAARTRRFIAGAVCPKCAEMDKIVVDMETNRRECVACDFTEERPTEGGVPAGAAAQELNTRVNRPAARLVETPAEAVTLIDPGKDS